MKTISKKKKNYDNNFMNDIFVIRRILHFFNNLGGL
jgi:hypothetical protein